VSTADSANAASRPVRLIVRDTATLRPHAAYVEVVGPISATRIAEVSRQPGSSNEPVAITQDGTIVDGHARWQAAMGQGLTNLPCLEHNLTDDEALAMLIARHSRSDTLNAFCRVALALLLEPQFKAAAIERLKTTRGSQHPSSLTNPDRLDVRRDIARVARVSTGNVTKVKQLLKECIPEVIGPLRQGAVSIHQAWQWRHLPRNQQRDALWAHQHRVAIDHTIRRLITQHVQTQRGSTTVGDVNDVVAKLIARARSFAFVVADVPGQALVITRELYESLIQDAVP